MTHERLLERLDALEAERRALMARLEGLSHERLEAAPPTGAWSVAQVIEHLALVEEGSLAYMMKKLEHKNHGPAGPSAMWRLLLLNAALRLPIRYRAPKAVQAMPKVNWLEARSRWETVRQRMREAYAALDPAVVGHAFFKHPSAGRFDLVQGMRFMRQHMRRHATQIERILAGRA